MSDANPVKLSKRKTKLAGPVGFVGRLSPRTHDLRVKSFRRPEAESPPLY
jgi:hypothetical protein